LRRCLTTVAESSAPTRVVVVDNASRDGSAAMVRAEFPGVLLIANAENLGFTRANNQGFAALGVLGILGASQDPLRAPRDAAPGPEIAAQGDAPPYVLILNPDTELADGALAALARHLDAHPTAGAVGPMLLNPDGSVQPSRRRFPTILTGIFEGTPLAWHWPSNPAARRFHMADVPPDVGGPVDWVTGAAVLLRAPALQSTGGFDEGFFMYSEELDLCRRLRDAGWAIHYCPDARVVHHEGQSSGQVEAARHLRFQRSRVRYFRKHHGRAAAAAVRAGVLAAFGIELLIEAGKWLAGHKRALRRARVAAYWRILRDGLGGEGPGGAHPDTPAAAPARP